MKTRIVKNILSDNSQAYDLKIVTDGKCITIGCESKTKAYELETEFIRCACWIEID